LEIDPKYFNAWYSKGIVIAQLGKYNEAVECFDKALEIDPQFVDALNKRDYLLGRMAGGEKEYYNNKSQGSGVEKKSRWKRIFR
jgi:tetratricopeptide (TPR) repeat protein